MLYRFPNLFSLVRHEELTATGDHLCRAVDMSYDDPGPGGMHGQVLQSPYQGTLAVLELLGYGNEDLVLHGWAFRRFAGVAGESARGRSEALRCLSPRGILHFRLAASWCRKVAVMQCTVWRREHQVGRRFGISHGTM